MAMSLFNVPYQWIHRIGQHGNSSSRHTPLSVELLLTITRRVDVPEVLALRSEPYGTGTTAVNAKQSGRVVMCGAYQRRARIRTKIPCCVNDNI